MLFLKDKKEGKSGIYKDRLSDSIENIKVWTMMELTSHGAHPTVQS